MNLIAYDMCLDFKIDFTVTSYMCFLDLLIDEAEDVKDLRDAGILYNGLRSDEEVARLFNKMNTDLVPSPMIYGGVKRKIHNHYLLCHTATKSTEEGDRAVGGVSTDQTIINNNTNNDSVSIDIECTDVALSSGELANLRSLDKALDGGQPTLRDKPLIRKVPSTLRRKEGFKKYFKPKVISIGPLHHDDPTLHESKELKLKLAANFFNNIDVHKVSLYSNMKKEIDSLKKCYDPQELEKYSDDDEKLAWMFFVDGCAILQAVYLRYSHDCDRKSKLFIKNDLLTFVYSDLFLLENQLPFRVLELLTNSGDGKKFMYAIIRFIEDTVINPAEMKEPQPHQQDSFKHIFFVGKLRLPPITVDDSTMNLIAYEMCPDFDNDFTVTSYMCFLDSLIDGAEDVRKLSDAGILYNGLGSDEEVAKLFNKMNTDLIPNPMIYGGVKRKIHNHCKNMWINHAARAYNTYFSIRWTFLAFVGAIASLFLSALQAYYTIHQRK
ncbi:uncharacterized protein LOC128283992 [Gossypium arboreum]|uniref:uncharacterized protein LOC128283992 n=1 Tax=Gossypium arboreum TaxID=29729 RepID=UPI0022F1525D|nr:uncharacterized protein LOC128283992 [Gossypium arboreum]